MTGREGRTRGFFGKRLYQLRHAPRPVFRAVLASAGGAFVYTLLYLAYDLHVERALRDGLEPIALFGGTDVRTEAAALLVILTVATGSMLTYLIVPQPTPDGQTTRRSGWSAALGLFASVPIAYLALVIESQMLKPLLLGP